MRKAVGIDLLVALVSLGGCSGKKHDGTVGDPSAAWSMDNSNAGSHEHFGLTRAVDFRGPHDTESSQEAVGQITAIRSPDGTAPQGLIALTYDDGPDAYTETVSHYLKSQNIRATFFITIDWGRSLTVGCTGSDPRGGLLNYPDSARQLVADGHRVANHTVDHCVLACDYVVNPSSGLVTNIDDAWELSYAQSFLDPFVGNELFMTRPPGGAWNAGDGSCAGGSPQHNVWPLLQMQPSLDKLRGPITWSAASLDYLDTATYGASTATASNYTVPRLQSMVAADGSSNEIILMHDRTANAVGTQFVDWETEGIVPYLQASGYVFVRPLIEFSAARSRSAGADFSDADWEGNEGYYGTLRLADVNGDGNADLCGRSSNGIVCATSTGVVNPGTTLSTHFNAATTWFDAELTDAKGWLPPEYSTTLQFGDIDGDGRADFCARHADGIVCATATKSNTFANYKNWSTFFSDANGWNSSAAYYGSIRLADINHDGKSDICARSASGVVCALSTGSSFGDVTNWLSDMTDAGGWFSDSYGTTLQLGDLDGDGYADLCARNVSGVSCALNNRNNQFAQLSVSWTSSWPASQAFSNKNGWVSSASSYGSIRLADINGDGKADICGRGEHGLVCGLSNGSRFLEATTWSRDYADPAWHACKYGTTILLGDINGDGVADVCGRDANGITCGLAP